MNQYRVSGRFRSRDGFQEFTKTVEAPNEDVARERALATVGSQHSRSRTKIDLEEVSEVSAS